MFSRSSFFPDARASFPIAASSKVEIKSALLSRALKKEIELR
jgi:hypothetical protein